MVKSCAVSQPVGTPRPRRYEKQIETMNGLLSIRMEPTPTVCAIMSPRRAAQRRR